MVLHPVLNPLRSCCLNHWQGHMYADTENISHLPCSYKWAFFFFLHHKNIFPSHQRYLCTSYFPTLCCFTANHLWRLSDSRSPSCDDLFMPQSDRQLHSSTLLGVSTYFWTLPFQIFHMWFFQHRHKYTLIKAETWHFIIDFLKLDALTKTVWFCISACDLFFFLFSFSWLSFDVLVNSCVSGLL